MNITDYSFTNNDAEYDLIKQLLLEIEAYPEMDNNWEPGRMDWWRYDSMSKRGWSSFTPMPTSGGPRQTRSWDYSSQNMVEMISSL